MSDHTSNLVPFSFSEHDFNSCIRRTAVNGITYFSLIDIMAEFSDTEADARYYWRDLKYRLERAGVTLDIQQIKLTARDGKQRITDVGTHDTCSMVLSILRQRPYRKPTALTELKYLHPLVENKLRADGYSVQRHVQLPSGKEIDLVAKNAEHTLIVECKTRLVGETFFNAVGQVICYQAELRSNSFTALATFAGCIDDYSWDIARRLRLRIIEV